MSESGILGIDWGTHSSKWAWTTVDDDNHQESGTFGILRSDVWVDARSHLVLTDDAPPQDARTVGFIKNKMIKSPEAAFWEGPLRSFPLTMGELATFSLWFLLCEAFASLHAKAKVSLSSADVRFSLPNWVGTRDAAYARASYEQAAAVACRLFHQTMNGSKGTTVRITIDQWRKLVTDARRELNVHDQTVVLDDPDGFRKLIESAHMSPMHSGFRFVVESSAAGLLGLRRGLDLWDSKSQVLNLLVVDVGAGSTDIGYVLRTFPKVGTAKVVLCQLPPASTCSVAGEDLTLRIQEIQRAKGHSISRDEAELMKISERNSTWTANPTVKEWVEKIASHVCSYVQSLPDKRWLPFPPGARVLVTGGSAVVPGLKAAVVDAVKNGMKANGIDFRVIEGVDAMDLALKGPVALEANRLAVCLGSSDADLPRLAYHSRLGPPAPHPTVRATRGSWT
jgi:hypothetical protein